MLYLISSSVISRLHCRMGTSTFMGDTMVNAQLWALSAIEISETLVVVVVVVVVMTDIEQNLPEVVA